MSTDPFQSLRDAIKFSPDNLPLRKHLAETLAAHGLWEEAEREYREALQLSPRNPSIQLALADCYRRQAKLSHALVILEELIRQPDADPRAYLLHARISLAEGDVERAVALYKEAIDLDPDVNDPQFAEMLGIDAAEDEEVVDGRIRVSFESHAERESVEIDRPKVHFTDVGGMDALKEEIRLKIIYPLQHAEMYAAYGKSVGGGILMYGPPGCGKTMMARATAGEIGAGFISVGLTDVLDMWMGNSERQLHELFDQARRNTPCVLFFDEVDALGASRTDMRQSAGRHLINQFLAELDGVEASNEGILVLGATNAPWHLDAAFRRPGRFDQVLFVPPPDELARVEILRLLSENKPTEQLALDQIAKKTKDFSGADLKAVMDRAIEGKLQEAMKSGIPLPLSTKDLLKAAKIVRPSTREWFTTARNYALYSNQGGAYDDILNYLGLK